MGWSPTDTAEADMLVARGEEVRGRLRRLARPRLLVVQTLVVELALTVPGLLGPRPHEAQVVLHFLLEEGELLLRELARLESALVI